MTDKWKTELTKLSQYILQYIKEVNTVGQEIYIDKWTSLLNEIKKFIDSHALKNNAEEITRLDIYQNLLISNIDMILDPKVRENAIYHFSKTFTLNIQEMIDSIKKSIEKVSHIHEEIYMDILTKKNKGPIKLNLASKLSVLMYYIETKDANLLKDILNIQNIDLKMDGNLNWMQMNPIITTKLYENFKNCFNMEYNVAKLTEGVNGTTFNGLNYNLIKQYETITENPQHEKCSTSEKLQLSDDVKEIISYSQLSSQVIKNHIKDNSEIIEQYKKYKNQFNLPCEIVFREISRVAEKNEKKIIKKILSDTFEECILTEILYDIGVKKLTFQLEMSQQLPDTNKIAFEELSASLYIQANNFGFQIWKELMKQKNEITDSDENHNILKKYKTILHNIISQLNIIYPEISYKLYLLLS